MLSNYKAELCDHFVEFIPKEAQDAHSRRQNIFQKLKNSDTNTAFF